MGRYIAVFSGNLPSAASQTTLTFNVDRGFDSVYLARATMASVSTIFVYGSDDGSRYDRIVNVAQTQVATSAMGFEISTASSGYAYAIPPGWPYYKVEVASAPADGIEFKLICMGD